MRVKPSLLLSLCLMVLSAWAVFAAMAWPWKAALFPLVIGIPVFLLAAVEFSLTAFGPEASAQALAVDFILSQHVDFKLAIRRTLAIFGWIIAFFLLILAFGFPAAIPAFVLLYLRAQAREGWLLSLTLAAVAWGFVYGLFVRLLNLPFPEGWVQAWLGALGVLR